MHVSEEAMMHIDAGIEVRLDFVVAHRAAEELSPPLFHPLTSAQGEPLPLRAAAGTVLRGAVRIHFHRYGAFDEGLLPPEPIDVSAQLIGLFAIESPGLARSPRLDLAQPFKEQDTAWVLRTHPRNRMRALAGGLAVHPTHIPPYFPFPLLSFTCLPSDPFLFT